MKDRYWLRHPSIKGHLGPYATSELDSAIRSKSFPEDSYVLRDEGQDELQRQTSTGWQPAWAVLDLPPPQSHTDRRAASPPAPPPPPTAADLAHARLQDVRVHTSYGNLRRLIRLAKVASLIAVLAVPAIGMLVGDLAFSLSTTIWAVIHVFYVLILAGLAQAQLDSSDAAMRQLK